MIKRNFLGLFSFFTLIFSSTLQEAFDNSEPFGNYDKYIILSQDMIYTGGIGIYEGKIFIDGNGAIIDLIDGSGIWVYSTEDSPSQLDIQYTTIINGAYYGINYSGNSSGKIVNCNFINNDFGAKFFDTCSVVIENSNFIQSATYAIGLYTLEPNIEISYSNFWNNLGGDLQENCPG